jgi:hypothetical protein
MEDLSALSARPRLRALLDHFAKIKDTRQSRKVAYPLREVLFLVVCGTIASGDDYEDIVDWLPEGVRGGAILTISNAWESGNYISYLGTDLAGRAYKGDPEALRELGFFYDQGRGGLMKDHAV